MPRDFHQACVSLLLAFVRAEPCPVKRAEMLRIMREHGHLGDGDAA